MELRVAKVYAILEVDPPYTADRTGLLLRMSLQDSESTLVQQAIERNQAAFTTLYERHVERVYRHVYFHVYNTHDAEDITQEVFMRAWKAIGSYKNTGVPFLAWLTAIARNLVADHHRAKRPLLSLQDTEAFIQTDDPTPEAISESNSDRDQIRKAVLTLKGDRRQVILMRFIDELSYADIAKALGKNEGAVRVIQYRALKDLRRILTESSGLK